VDRIAGRDIACTVEEGGTVRSAKGMNLPGVRVRAPVLSDKDRDDLAWAIARGVDLVALSFVRSADDLAVLREACRPAPHPPGIIAKIERAEAIEDIDAILAAADGIMVARGDLGTEIGHHRLPAVQKDLLRRAGEAGRLAITATQMLESMVDHPVPTRAEASDVANAVYDDSDAVMLSAETAVGIDPARAVRQMATICREAERGEWCRRWTPDPARCEIEVQDLVLARAAVDLAVSLPARVILVRCDDDIDLRLLPLLGKLRSPVPVCVTCQTETLWRRLAAVWGVVPLLAEDTEPEQDDGSLFDRLVESGTAAVGDTVVVLEGAGVAGPTSVAVRQVTA
jgi:pyruvate kinase